MKHISTIVAFLLVAAVFFFIGKCSGPSARSKETVTVKQDTIWKERPLTIDPVPKPVRLPQTKTYVVSNKKELQALLEKLKSQRDYYERIIQGKEAAIAELEAVESEVGSGLEDEGVGETVAENQEPNLYKIDTLTPEGIGLKLDIMVLGELFAPPFITFTLPEIYRQQTRNATKNTAIGVALALRLDWVSPSTMAGTFAGARLHYRRKNFFLGGGAWTNTSTFNLTGAEVFAGAEIAWRKK